MLPFKMGNERTKTGIEVLVLSYPYGLPHALGMENDLSEFISLQKAYLGETMLRRTNKKDEMVRTLQRPCPWVVVKSTPRYVDELYDKIRESIIGSMPADFKEPTILMSRGENNGLITLSLIGEQFYDEGHAKLVKCVSKVAKSMRKDTGHSPSIIAEKYIGRDHWNGVYSVIDKPTSMMTIQKFEEIEQGIISKMERDKLSNTTKEVVRQRIAKI